MSHSFKHFTSNLRTFLKYRRQQTPAYSMLKQPLQPHSQQHEASA